MRGRGRRPAGGPSSRHERAPGPSTTQTDPLKDAEVAAQRARRRPLVDSLDALAAAAASFRAAAAAAPPARAADAWFGLGDTLVVLAERTQAAAARTRDGVLTATTERAAAAAAVALLDEAVAAFSHPSLTGVAAAAVNAGNALCAGAEAVVAAAGSDAVATGRPLVARAIAAYDAVLASAPDDTDTAVNRADALKQAGELALDAGDVAGARAALTAADAAYAAALATASSDDGDDVPSILHNWGVALHCAARAGGGGDALSAAAARLRDAASFSRGDVAPLLALGDVLCDAAALDAALPGVTPESAALLAAARADGYGGALAIDRKCADAHAGVAEVELTLARAAAAVGDAEGARNHAAESARAYSRALADPAALGGWADRAGARFNAACALCLAGEVDRARAAVEALVASGAATEAEVAADADLAALRG